MHYSENGRYRFQNCHTKVTLPIVRQRSISYDLMKQVVEADLVGYCLPRSNVVECLLRNIGDIMFDYVSKIPTLRKAEMSL